MSFAGAPNEAPKRCKGCMFRQKNGGISICAYCLITGEPRGSSVEECTHYFKRPRGMTLRAERLENRKHKKE